MDGHCYLSIKRSVDSLADHVKAASPGGKPSFVQCALVPCSFSRSMQRRLDDLLKCSLTDDQERCLVLRSALSFAERAIHELTAHHQTQAQHTISLWTAIRSHGCQFLGPAMQEEVLKLILLALEDGSALSRKVLVQFIVQRLQMQFPQASKTAVGHVVQLLYRASCFIVMKRDEESSLMQLKEEFRNYDSLRRQHDTQIVEMSMEVGLRIGPEQWSCLLYGDSNHKSHMQSIIDRLLRNQTFAQNVDDLSLAMKQTNDPFRVSTELRDPLNLLTSCDLSTTSTLSDLDECLKAIVAVTDCLARVLRLKQGCRPDPVNPRYESPNGCNNDVQTVSNRNWNNPLNPDSKSRQKRFSNESFIKVESENSMQRHSQQPPISNVSSEPIISDVTESMRSCQINGQSPSRYFAKKEDMFSPSCRRYSEFNDELFASSPYQPVSFHVLHQPQFLSMSPMVTVVSKETASAPCQSALFIPVSLCNQPMPANLVQPQWFPAAADACGQYDLLNMQLNSDRGISNSSLS